MFRIVKLSRDRPHPAGDGLWPRHEVTERHPDGGFTIRYLAGPKRGLLIHFFTDAELGALFASRFTPVLPPRLQHNRRAPPGRGQWSQWEAIWRKTTLSPDHTSGSVSTCPG